MPKETNTKSGKNSSKISKCVVLLLLALLFFTINIGVQKSFSPRIEIHASGPDYSQSTLFIDYGNGLIEEKSLLNRYQFNRQKTRLIFPINKKQPKKIRFDPIQQSKPESQQIEIHSILLKYHLFGPKCLIPLHNLKPHLDVKQLETTDSIRYSVLENTPDPQLLINPPINWEQLQVHSFSISVYKQCLFSGLLLSMAIIFHHFAISPIIVKSTQND